MAFQDFDQISLRRREERKQKIRKRIIIAVVVILVILLGAGAAVGYLVYKSHQDVGTHQRKASPAPPKPAAVNTPEKTVKSVCGATDYKETCETSLMKEFESNATAQTKDILRFAFIAASNEIDNVIRQVSEMKFEDPRKKAAVDDCMVLLADAKEELNYTISTANDWGSVKSMVPDLNNWLSAVLSYQGTCIDGFEDGEEKVALQKMMNTSMELGSNALAIVSQITSVLGRLLVPEVKRHLLTSDDDTPIWVDVEGRRMLKADITKFVPNATVAKDGSGNFTTINEALNAMPLERTDRYVIYVKEGIYEENVIITKKMVNVTMYGDGSQKSMISGNKNFVDGVQTFQTATFAALGDGFMAVSLGFRNTAGPEKHQAVALRVQADRSIFLNCRMEGYQDTLYAQTHRQYYKSCYITGTVDFIFGDAAAVFQTCNIVVRKPMENQQNIVTAQGRMDKRQTTGIVLQSCKILADDALEPEKANFKSYLGRPWKEYSRTIVMESDIGDLIVPEGWLEWNGDFALNTLFYGEYNNKGPGSDTSARVKWPGCKVIKREEAARFTVTSFLQGESWIKPSDVPVRFGMFT